MEPHTPAAPADARPADGASEVRQEVLADFRAKADLLRAFDHAGFGVPTGTELDADRNLLAAGALMRAGNALLSDLFEDTALLLNEFPIVAAEPNSMRVLDRLPPAFTHLYTHLFAERFSIAVSEVVRGLNHKDWTPNGTIAERLALDLIIKTARRHLELADLIGWSDSDTIYEPFRAAVFTDRDHEALYDLPLHDLSDEIAAWFQPASGRGPIHPFLRG